jgi:hypothetical protein
MGLKTLRSGVFLWVGDLAVIAIITLVGFASHGEILAAGWRMLTTFLPLTAAWLVVGLPAGLFDVTLAKRADQLWRSAWGMVVAAPLAVLLRSLFLELRPIMPVFGFVIMGVSVIAILIWRIVFFWLAKGRSD